MYRLPRRIRSDNGSEFTAQNVQRYLEQHSLSSLHIAPSSPWQNGYVERFNHKFRDELLNYLTPNEFTQKYNEKELNEHQVWYHYKGQVRSP